MTPGTDRAIGFVISHVQTQFIWLLLLFSAFCVCVTGNYINGNFVSSSAWQCLTNSVYRCKKSIRAYVAFKIYQNAFPALAPSRTLLGSSRCSPRPANRLGKEHLSPYPNVLCAFRARHSAPSALYTLYFYLFSPGSTNALPLTQAITETKNVFHYAKSRLWSHSPNI